MTCGKGGILVPQYLCLVNHSVQLNSRAQTIPGCSVESTIFFAFHSSGLISLTCPCLYAAIRLFAFSSPAPLTSNVLLGVSYRIMNATKQTRDSHLLVSMPLVHLTSDLICLQHGGHVPSMC